MQSVPAGKMAAEGIAQPPTELAKNLTTNVRKPVRKPIFKQAVDLQSNRGETLDQRPELKENTQILTLVNAQKFP